MSMKPSIGRIVHYTNLGDREGKYPPEIQAAVITGVNDDGTVALHIFYKTGQFDMASVAHTDEAAGTDGARGKWAWPARE
jgi:chemotaxis response regulator CheB